MKPTVLFALAIPVLGLTATPAAADWKYTHWGMHPTDVIAASAGLVVAGDGSAEDKVDGLQVGAVGQYVAGSYTFRAIFHFDDVGLKQVTLNLTQPESGKCATLRSDFVNKYGAGVPKYHRDVLRITEWQDQALKNNIDMVMVGPGGTTNCSLIYRQLPSGGGAAGE